MDGSTGEPLSNLAGTLHGPARAGPLCQLVTAVAAALERLCLPWSDWRLDATKLDVPSGATLPPEVVAAMEALDRSGEAASQVARSGRKPSDLAGACRRSPWQSSPRCMADNIPVVVAVCCLRQRASA